MKNLKLLLSLRAWLKSGTLQTGGIIAALGQAQVWLATDEGVRIMELIAGQVGMTAATFTGWVTSAIGIVFLWHRTRTETNLAKL